MDFGRIDAARIADVDFTLPLDTPLTTAVLSTARKSEKPRVYVGCAKWGRPDWIGKIYPPKTKSADFLKVYAQQFNSVELNSVYYNLPTPQGMRKWRDTVGDDFLFCPKFSEVITHHKRLQNVAAELDQYLNAIHELGSNLGPLFLMPEPRMGPKYKPVIEQFIQSLPGDITLFVEYRQKEWLQPQNAAESFDYLKGLNAGTVITDTSGRRDALHMNLTTPQAFIRFVGNGLHPTDYVRIDAWVERIGEWLEAGLERCYFFMHQHDERYSPELCKYLIEQLNAKLALGLKVPVFYGGGDKGLF